MPSYNVRAINIGSFNLGEADKVLTIFSPEKGIQKAVAKGARRPGTKMSGRTDVLCVNELHLSSGRTFEIITQAQSIESFSALRIDFSRLSYGLYYAELTACFGQGLEEDSQSFFEFLIEALCLLGKANLDATKLCMEFEFGLLEFLGYMPELTFCISCRNPLSDYNLSRFVLDTGGIICSACYEKSKRVGVSESVEKKTQKFEYSRAPHITPLVWKTLILRANRQESQRDPATGKKNEVPHQVLQAAQRLLQSYIEWRAGKHFKSLDVMEQMV